MKVTSVEIIEAKHYLFVKVHTDAGITGLGEAGNWGFLQATKGAIEKFSEFLIGQDPFRIEHHYQHVQGHVFPWQRFDERNQRSGDCSLGHQRQSSWRSGL